MFALYIILRPRPKLNITGSNIVTLVVLDIFHVKKYGSKSQKVRQKVLPNGSNLVSIIVFEIF